MSQTCKKCGASLPAVLNGVCPVCVIDLSTTLTPSFGDFELLDEIARGGMGVVYRAHQKSLDREIAVKLILSGQFASEQSRERFRIEAKATAKLRHPNIVSVHEFGEQDGFAYYTMDYIRGESLAEVAHETPMAPQKAAQCVKQIAEAIEYAHQHGVLHRDLKPSNVLLDSAGCAHVTDFGLAKFSNTDTGPTLRGELLGSPHYIPPEQARGEAKTCGVWSDVYSLGAILYHLITGRPPFLGQTITDTLDQVVKKDPVAPRLLVPSVPRDLETICLKCMQKEPHRRYQAAQEVADELDRFLAGKPIRAFPISYLEKIWRWCRREPALASLIGTSVLLLLTGSLLVFAQWRRAEASLEENRQLIYLRDMNVGFTSLVAAELDPLRAALRRQIPAPGQNDLRGFEWRYLLACAYPVGVMRLPERPQVAGSTSFSPDGAILAVYYWDDTIRWWNLKTGKEFRAAFTNASALGAFAPNGEEYVLGGRDGTIRVLNLRTGELVRKFDGVGELVAITPDAGTAVTINAGHQLKVIDLGSGKFTFSMKAKVRRRSDLNWGAAVAISDDGRTLAVNLPYEDPKPSLKNTTKIELYDVESNSPWPTLQQTGELDSLLFTHDGKSLITGWGNGNIILAEVRGTNRLALSGHKFPVLSLALSPDGSTLASGSSDESILLWDIPSGETKPKIASTLLGFVWSLAFSPDGEKVAAGGRNAGMTILDLRKVPVPEQIPGTRLSSSAWGNFTFSPNGKLMAGVCEGDVLKVWETETLRLVAQLENVPYVASFSPDSKALLAAHSQLEPFWWKLEPNEITLLPLRGTSGVDCADVTADGRFGILGHRNGTLQLVDIEAGTEVASWLAHDGGVMSVRFSGPDIIISGGRDRAVAMWDRLTRKRITWNPGEHRGAVCALAYSQKTARMASGCLADVIKIWDPTNLSKALFAMPYHKAPIRALDFSKDGKTLASGSEDKTVRLLSVLSRQEFARFEMDSPVRLVLFSPDDNILAIVTDSGTLRLLRATPLERADAQVRALTQ